MKFQTTKKAVKNGYCNVIEIGYCEAQNLLRYHDPIAYTCGTYGWNSDIYVFGNTAISTGYNAFGNVRPDYKVIREYDKKARKIIDNRQWKYDTKKRKVDQLIDKFIAEAIA